MADKDDADAANATASASPKPATSHLSSFAAVNKPSPHASPSTANPSKSPSPATTRLNGVSAKTSAADSQPMTATSSSSSHVATQPNGGGAETNGVSPYGTRSRNRTGTSRPNYAEDRDIDMDFEASSKKKGQPITPSAPLAIGETEKSSGSNTRRSSNSTAAAQSSSIKPVPSNPTKDNLPGMSSFSVHPENAAPSTVPGPSRKRKAPGAVPSNNINTQSPNSSATAMRRAGPATTATSTRASTLLTFEKCNGYLKNGKLKADDGSIFGADDQIYLICEPPGEPYYLARIMEFLHVDNDRTKPVDSLRVNWYFRPRDIQRKVNDTRVVFASMQSDTCPITSIRGKCRVSHRSEIENLDDFRKGKDSFWYEKMFDRYIHRYYEVIPTHQVINVPSKVKRVLDERWKYVIVEIGRGKDLTSAIKSCRRCTEYCASNDSVDCAVCKNTYHMNCVRPPLLKKPARGFGWSCGPCSRRQERRLEARNTASGDKNQEGEEEELVEEEEEDCSTRLDGTTNQEIDQAQKDRPQAPTAEQLAQSKLWPYRYLGIHCRVEDALDYDDRIYPRASSRLGPKHQANVQVWHGQAVEFVKPIDIKKKYLKGTGNKKDAKLTKDTLAALEAEKASREKRPKWVIDEPTGFVPRGEDEPTKEFGYSGLLQFKMPQVGELSSRGLDSSDPDLTLEDREKIIDSYMKKAKAMAQPTFNLRDFSTNFLDKALELLTANKYDTEKALVELEHQRRRQDLKEPELTEEEIRRFEEGVARYGSELRNVSRHVGKSQTHGEIVRFYYMWKKTDRGKTIWNSYEGRKGKKQSRQADARLADDVADDDDDSAFDSTKAVQRKRGFECKFCGSRKSPQWRRAPATAPGTTVPTDSSSKGTKDKTGHLVLALCQRCAVLWRKYGIQWENIDEVAKKVAQGGGRAWKRRIDEELLIELVKANQASSIGLSSTTAAAAASVGLDVPPDSTNATTQEGSRKKAKPTNPDPLLQSWSPNDTYEEVVKKKTPEKMPEPQLVPEKPQLRLLPCEICNSGVKDDPTLVVCRYCRLTVHPNCYGIPDDRGDKWLCDTCENDVRPEYSTIYECLLCPQYKNEDDSIMEPPKQTHKKKSDREKEKDRLEKEMITQATAHYVKEQEEKGRPIQPRQALKPTAQRNWSHVICSILHPSIRFGDSNTMQLAEGFVSTQQPLLKGKDGKCKLCKDTKGAVVFCDQCEAPVHASCAQRYGYTIGLSLAPKPKSSTAKTISIGDSSGIPDAKVYCRDHGEKKSVYPFFTPATVDGQNMNALRAFTITSKSIAQGSLTGTARRADLIQAATRHAAISQTGEVGTARSKPLLNEPAPVSTRANPTSPEETTVHSEEIEDGDRVLHLTNGVTNDETPLKECLKCQTLFSPKWHKSPDYNTASTRPLSGISQDLKANSVLNGSLDGAHDDVNAASLSGSKDEGEESPLQSWLCHKCFIRKSKAPADPPREVTPEPKATDLDRNERQSSPLNRSLPWQPPNQLSSESSAPPPPESHTRWPNQPEPVHPPFHAPERLPNGVSHSSPATAPLHPPAYVPTAPHQGPHHLFAQHSYPYRDDRQGYRPSQPLTHHQPNGYTVPEPASFQYQRDPTNGTLIRVPWPPRGTASNGVQSSHHTSPNPVHSPPIAAQHVRSPPVHLRSPSFHEQGPNGPPEADSNPFAVPATRPSHASPPLQPLHYQGNNVYGSPHVRSRPETPITSHDHDSRRASEVPVQNGASASPSVRNLLH